MKITRISIIALMASVAFTSCSSEVEEKSDKTTEKKEEVVKIEETVVIEEDADLDKELQFKIDLIIGNNITGPSKMITDVKAQGVGRYQDGLTVPMEGAKSFGGTSVSKGLALGALGVDVTFLSVYDRADLALKYIASINKLNEDLDCGMLIDGETLDAFEAAKEDGEKMSQLMYDQYFLMEGYLKSNDRLETAANVMVGGIVESLFITTSQMLDGELTEEAINVIYAQKQAITDLIGVYQDMEGNESIIDELTEVQTLLSKSSAEFTKEDLTKLNEIVKGFHDEIANEEIL